MNDYGIPIIEPTVDFTKVPPIHQKRTITFINHFIVQTCTFLNKFSLLCEERLFEFENKLQRVEASLELLEFRLSSIPESDTRSADNSNNEIEPNNEVKEEGETRKDDFSDPKSDTREAEAPSVDKIDNSNMQPISKDPRYLIYFKMVRCGVPVESVRLKMKLSGVDPLILDDPDRLVPIIDLPDDNTTTTTDED